MKGDNMKKVLSLLLIAVMLFAVVSCADKTDNVRADEGSSTTESATDGKQTDTVKETVGSETTEPETTETETTEPETAEPETTGAKTEMGRISVFRDLLEEYSAVWMNNDSYEGLDDSYRVYAGRAVLYRLYDYSAERDSVWKKILPENWVGNTMVFSGMPEIYYWIKYKGLKEEDVRRVNGELMEEYLSGDNESNVRIAELLTSEDIDVLFHGTETEIKKHFRMPFSYITEDGEIISPYTLYYNRSELLNEKELAEYRQLIIDDLIRLSQNDAFFRDRVTTPEYVDEWLYGIVFGTAEGSK